MCSTRLGLASWARGSHRCLLPHLASCHLRTFGMTASTLRVSRRVSTRLHVRNQVCFVIWVPASHICMQSSTALSCVCCLDCNRLGCCLCGDNPGSPGVIAECDGEVVGCAGSGSSRKGGSAPVRDAGLLCGNPGAASDAGDPPPAHKPRVTIAMSRWRSAQGLRVTTNLVCQSDQSHELP